MAALRAFVQDQGRLRHARRFRQCLRACPVADHGDARAEPHRLLCDAHQHKGGHLDRLTARPPLRWCAVSGTDLASGRSGLFYIVSFSSATTEYIITGVFALGLSDLPTIADGSVLSNISRFAKPSANTLADRRQVPRQFHHEADDGEDGRWFGRGITMVRLLRFGERQPSRLLLPAVISWPTTLLRRERRSISPRPARFPRA